jgi:biopolymer transport protein ExbB/TolQ
MKTAIICLIKFLTVILLPTLFVAAIALSYLQILDIGNISLHTLYIVVIIYLIFILFTPHNAYISECKIRGKLKSTKEELEKALEKTTLTVERETKSVMNIREFLEDYFQNIRNENFANIASSTFPMLGILGTFIAIAISMPNFSVENLTELDAQISNLLSGVGTAFYASIFGIFLSLVWNFFDKYGLSKIENITLMLENLYSKYIWSKRELLSFQYRQKSIFENEFIKTLKDTFNADFIKDLNREHLNSYKEIVKTTREGLGEIEKSLHRTNNQLISSLNRLYLTKETIEAQIALEENIKEFNRSAKELKRLLEGFDYGVDNALRKIDRELAKSVRHIQRIVEVTRDRE